MSSATIEIDPIASDEETLHYRALHTGALIGLVLGVLSVFVFIIARNSFEGCLLVAPIPLVGTVVSLWSIIKIRRQADQYTGQMLAQLGLALSLLFLVGGVSYGGYIYATEVPDGYSRISFNTMKPDELQERGGVTVPPEVSALEGRKIFIKGYIRPDSITVPRGIRGFLLVRDNNQCCFGDLSKIKYYDQILVAMTGGRHVDYSQGVFRIGGTLHIEPQYAATGAPRPVFSLKADYAH
jgi:hypothetical protein